MVLPIISGLRFSLQEGSFNEIVVSPLLAFGSLDTVHKNKCLD